MSADAPLVRVVVDARLRLRLDGLPSGCADRLREDFTHDNPDHDRWRRLSPETRARRPEPKRRLRTWREERGELSLPRGGTGRVREALADHGRRPEWSDERIDGDGPRPEGLTLGPTLVEFQAEMVEAALRAENCLLRGPTGCGKTLVAEAVAMGAALCTLILVPSTKIFDQWIRRLREELGLAEDEIGVVRGARRSVRAITVAMVQTFARHAEELAPFFGAVIFDEVHRAAASTFFPAVDALAARYRVGVTADERRKDRKEFLVYDLFGAVVADVDRRELIDVGFILETEVRMIPTEFEAPWYLGLPNDRRRDDEAFDMLLREMIADEARTRLAVDVALGEMAAAHVVLAFSHRVDHCARVRADVAAEDPRVGLVVGEAGYEQEGRDTLAGIAEGRVVAAVGTYGSMGTGVDIPSADRGIAMTPVHTNRPFFGQLRGRLCRKDRAAGATKRDSALFVLWDRKVQGVAPLRNMVRWTRGNVRVLDGGEWLDGRTVLRRLEAERRGEDDPTGGLLGEGS